MEYLGHICRNDPLRSVLDRITGTRGEYRVFKLCGSNAVYLYEECSSNSRMIGKYFLSPNHQDRKSAARHLEREFNSLQLMRSRGFTAYPHYIARPLGCCPELNALLLEEYCGGETLSSVIRNAIRRRDDDILYDRLTSLAWFLAEFHNRGSREWRKVDFIPALEYMCMLLQTLQQCSIITENDAVKFRSMADQWQQQEFMYSDRQVMLHGDATPENFLFGGGRSVISFDLERSGYGDRVLDVGRIAGELAHFFMTEKGSRDHAEPFIGHFLWEYSCHFPDRQRTFGSITARVPFYMGCTLLRIARNNYLPAEYRRQLTAAAAQCLEF